MKEILKKVRKYEIEIRKYLNNSNQGDYNSIFKGSGIDFDDFRNPIDSNGYGNYGILDVSKPLETSSYKIRVPLEAMVGDVKLMDGRSIGPKLIPYEKFKEEVKEEVKDEVKQDLIDEYLHN